MLKTFGFDRRGHRQDGPVVSLFTICSIFRDKKNLYEHVCFNFTLIKKMCAMSVISKHILQKCFYPMNMLFMDDSEISGKFAQVIKAMNNKSRSHMSLKKPY